MSFQKALGDLAKKTKRLEPKQGRIARRNARRAIFGAMTSLRNALDAEFPAIEKPKKKPDVIQVILRATLAAVMPKMVKYKLPLLGRCPKFKKDVADLFQKMVGEIHIERVSPMGWATNRSIECYRKCPGLSGTVNSLWSDRENWQAVLHHTAHVLTNGGGHGDEAFQKRERAVIERWKKFLNGSIACPDLDLLAQHHQLLEQWGKLSTEDK